MNISFCHLGEEECEICLAYHAHIKDCDKKQDSDVLKEIMNTIEETELRENVDFQVHSVIESDVCDLWFDWREHIHYASVSRKAYENDCDVNSLNNPTTKYCSTDM